MGLECVRSLCMPQSMRLRLSKLDPIEDPRLAVPPADLACELCGFPDQAEVMLLCDVTLHVM